jgi:DNA-binding winged helix-turn-helix (wHTH) protein/predicted ATPase
MRRFRSFRLDSSNQCLWSGEQRLPLAPKAFDVLRYLVERPGRLVTQDEILEALWPETYVNPELVKKYILGIRKVLGDKPDEPEFVETIPKRGYRFVAPVTEDVSDGNAEFNPESPKRMVGRDAAMAALNRSLANALRGQRQVVFITGEAGIGKTTLVDALIQRSARTQNLRIARGQCVEGFGGKEAYFPVLEALGHLARGKDASLIVEVLARQAPTWLMQFPSLVKPEQRETLQRELVGATRDRMLRELCEAMESLTSLAPLLLILEDLHWVDPSTLDLISAVARRRQSAKLMIIGTYRPAEVVLSRSPLKGLKRELLVHNQCTDLPLERLEESEIAKFVAGEFPGLPSGVSHLIFRHSGGNALFMTAILQDLQKGGLIACDENGWTLTKPVTEVAITVPETLQGMLEGQFERLGEDERHVLECASIAGEHFSVWAVTHMLEMTPEKIEDVCERLSERGQFIKSASKLANSADTGYEFRHSLYRQAIYGTISDLRRGRLHRTLGHALVERGAGATDKPELASEVALHFERGGEHMLAIAYLQKAAGNASRRFAYHEAVGLARHGLELLEALPDTRERVDQELRLQLTLGVPLIATQGYAAPDVGRTYVRARTLCQRLGDTPEASEALWGLWTFHTLRAEFGAARELAHEFLDLGERLAQPGILMRGHWAAEITYTHIGEFPLALEHFDKALAFYNPTRHLDDGFIYALNPGVAMPCFASWSLWFLGHPDQALCRIQEAVSFARTLSEPLGLAHALFFAAIVHQFRREAWKAQEYAEATIAISDQHGLTMYKAMATIVRSWAAILQGGEKGLIEEMQNGLSTLEGQETKLVRPHFLALLAEVFEKAGRLEDGLPILDEALAIVNDNGEGYYEAELYRLKGELLLASPDLQGASTGSAGFGLNSAQVENAHQCFSQAIKIARRQKAKSLELRAVVRLARFYKQNSRRQEARQLVAELYGQFAEGFHTADLCEAKTLLDEL